MGLMQDAGARGGATLPECPETPNCTKMTVEYAAPAPEVYRSVLTALQAIKARVTSDTSTRVSAEAPIGPFIDDVGILITASSDTCRVTIRSASRVGRWDLGVNGRRVRRIIRTLDAAHPRLDPSHGGGR